MVVSGHMLVHSESTKASTTTFPRNWLSDVGVLNWLVRVKFGAGLPCSGVPGSMLTLNVPVALLVECPFSSWIRITNAETARTARTVRTLTMLIHRDRPRIAARPALPPPGPRAITGGSPMARVYTELGDPVLFPSSPSGCAKRQGLPGSMRVRMVSVDP